MFITALFTIAKMWKQSKSPSMGEWVKKMCFTHTKDYYSALRKKDIFPFAAT